MVMMFREEGDPSPGQTICADSVITRTISASDEDDADYDKEIRKCSSAPAQQFLKLALLNLYGIMRKTHSPIFMHKEMPHFNILQQNMAQYHIYTTTMLHQKKMQEKISNDDGDDDDQLG